MIRSRPSSRCWTSGSADQRRRVDGAAAHGLPLDRGAGLLSGRPLPRVQRHPQRPDAALGRDHRRGRRLPRSRPATPTGTPSTGAAGWSAASTATAASPAPSTTARSPCWPTGTTASGSTAPTTSSSAPTARSGSPTRATASTATTRATGPTARSAAATSTASTRSPARSRIVADDFDRPNGLAFSADERQLYIVDTRAQAHPPLRRRATDGTPVRRARCSPPATPAASTASALDDAGRIWAAAHDGLHCFDPDGTLIGKLRVPEIVANLTFGGPQRNQLFISATTSLYSIRVNVTGVAYPAGQATPRRGDWPRSAGRPGRTRPGAGGWPAPTSHRRTPGTRRAG